MPAPAPIYRFDSFELRPRTRELYKAGTKLRLRPQPFQVLQLLAERAGDVVSREELRESLWSKKTFVDFEHGLNTSIKELRGVLSDSANKPRYIETLPKLGYRLIVPVEVNEPPPGEAEDHTQTKAAGNLGGERNTSERRSQASAARQWPAVLAVSLVLIAALGAYFLWSRSRPRLQPPGGRAMLAVLPFENLTGDASQDYFSDGLTEEMIGQLGRLDPQHLGVIARTSVMHYKRTREPLQQIGSALGVQYVLEGSVRRDSNNVRISAQLIQLKDQTHLWSRQYDRELGSLLDLQGEIAREAAEEIQVTLGVPKHIEVVIRDRSAVSPDSKAYELYLKGLYFWNRRTVAGFNQAIEYFQQAISKDSNYAPAYAGLADCYALIGGYSTAPQTEFMPKARAAALRALQINDGLAEAHTALALIVQNYDWDWEASEREYRRAIELDANYATAHHWYAEHLSWLGRFDEAFRESERARQLDPLSLIIGADHAEILYLSRQYDRAIEELRAVREMEPNFPRAGLLVNALVEKGQFDDALAETARERRAVGDGPWLWETLAYVYGRSGKPKQGRHAIHELEQLNQRQRIDPASIAWGYVALGDKDKAFTWLEKAYAQHANVLHTLNVEPGFDPVRNDPRFQDLLRRVGLVQ